MLCSCLASKEHIVSRYDASVILIAINSIVKLYSIGVFLFMSRLQTLWDDAELTTLPQPSALELLFVDSSWAVRIEALVTSL